MKLRWKTLLIVATTLVCLLAILGVLARVVLLRGFATVENTSATRDVNRLRDAIAESVKNLGIKAVDWAKWDDTYRYVEDRNEAYAESNLSDSSLEALGLRYVFMINNAGEVVFDRAFDAEAATGMPVPDDVRAAVLADTALLRHADVSSFAQGILVLPGGPVTATARPILTSGGEGPVHGTLIFARDFGEAEATRLGEITHLSVVIRPVSASDLPPDMAARRTTLSGTGIAIAPLDSKRIAGYTVLSDLHDRPVMIARVDTPRDINAQGLRTVAYLIASILVAGVCFGLVIMVLLQRTVLSRVSGLDVDVRGIADSGEHSRRVELPGKDELADLGSSINSMLEALERSEAEVRSRSSEMRLVMNTVPTGLLSIDESYRVNPEYSRSVEQILKLEELAGEEIFDVLGMTGDRSADRGKLTEFLDVLRKELLPDTEMAGLNPFEEYRNGTDSEGRERWLRLTYRLIRREENQPKHILVVIEDISEAKAMSARAAQSERENIQLKVIAEDPDLFREFLSETTRIVRHAELQMDALVAASEPKPIVNEVFRDVHTVKGTASSFGLAPVADIAGRMEDSLSPLRDSGAISVEMMADTRASLGLLRDAIAAVVEQTRGILGDEGADGGTAHLRVSLERLRGAAAAVDRLVAEALRGAVRPGLQEEIARQLEGLTDVPARRALARALKIVPGLLTRVGKSIRFTVVGEDTPIPYEIGKELNTPLVHLLRNSFDHGIEDPEKRIARGKTEEGEVTLVVERDGGSLLVRVRDDGRGLDPRQLKSVAVSRGVLTQEEADHLSDAEAQALIFRPGFSTAERVTDVSGRGVGMDAVVASVKDALGGTVSIQSETGKGTTITLSIPRASRQGRIGSPA
jgi:sensor domain CHASE-containing protein/signal transduction histidine kinase